MGKRWSRWLVLVTGLALGAGWIWWATRPEPVVVLLAEVERGTVERTVANTRAGTVKACRRARLSPSIGGQIARLPVREGDKVKQGDLLLELWNQDVTAELTLAEREAQAARASARAVCLRSRHARREADRARRLIDRKLVSEEQLDKAETEAGSKAADCQAAEVQAAVRETRIGVVRATLEKTRLLAPFDGVVAEISGELSEYVTPSPIGIPTPPAIDLIDVGCFYVAAPIDEVDVAGVALGQPARITLDAFDERRFDGQVRRISDYVLDFEKQARTVEVEVGFSHAEDITQLLAGYSADVEIILNVRTDTLRIPTEALLEGDRVYVFLPVDGLIEQREVRTGTANWDHTEILSGLAKGDLVVTSVDREGLEDGVRAVRDKAGDGRSP